MFLYNNLEKIIQKSLTIYKHGQCLYQGIEDCPYEYEIDTYRVCVSEPVDKEVLDLIRLIIEKNEQSQPFWLRILKDLPYSNTEVPDKFKHVSQYQIWLLKASQLSENIEIIQALLTHSEVIPLNSEEALVIVSDNEELSEMDLISHLETEAMINARLYMGPVVKNIDDISFSYKQTVLLKDLKSNQTIVRFSDVLFERMIYDLSDASKNQLLKLYLDLYPISNLTEELLETIHGFFLHNLNVTDTAHALFLHRNTLVYRLNRIQQLTQLDIRQFEDANKMKILLNLM